MTLEMVGVRQPTNGNIFDVSTVLDKI
jgi:hypothetical protein